MYRLYVNNLCTHGCHSHFNPPFPLMPDVFTVLLQLSFFFFPTYSSECNGSEANIQHSYLNICIFMAYDPMRIIALWQYKKKTISCMKYIMQFNLSFRFSLCNLPAVLEMAMILKDYSDLRTSEDQFTWSAHKGKSFVSYMVLLQAAPGEECAYLEYSPLIPYIHIMYNSPYLIFPI